MFDALAKLFFEDLLLLLVLAAGAMAVAVAIHRRRGTPATRRGILIVAAAAVLMLLLQWLVVTDREKLRTLVRDLVRAVDQGDVAAISERVAPEGVTLGRGSGATTCEKTSFVALAENGLQQYQIDEAGAGGFAFKIDGDRATVDFRVTCDLRQARESQYRSVSQWKMECCRTPGGWKLCGIPAASLGLPGLASMEILPQLRSFQRNVPGSLTR